MAPSGSSGRRRGRPPAPVDASASNAARLGAEIRTRRENRGLTLEAFGQLIEFSAAHVSEVERGRSPVSEQFVAACDETLEAGGALLDLLPSVVCERAAARHRNQALRRESGTRSIETGAIVDEVQGSVPSLAPLVARPEPVKAAPVGDLALRGPRRLRPSFLRPAAS